MVIVSSWQNLGFDEVDLGSGRPARVTSRIRERPHFPALGMLPPCKGRDGANVLSVVVKEKHADAFLRELAKFM
ncbi:10-deacetylbaccatin III 10-O-acetyltransferase-like [Panicum miliaceum]|uniref:10-deacetylbaccatin III 10-O-acetyltransferase-like n=1 Tax=Panicum miliaceum TaxID=4540 RepID=A0A3L6SUN2_PANMI|nr:10-deacetylbaccatin III 10-O-acetyltransferase-like [Panicum miliaceum]